MPAGRKYGGRVKGTPNRVTGDIKCMIENALTRVGGEQYLIDQATQNPVAFLNLVGKILPKDVNAKVTGDMILKVITGVPSATE